MKTSLTSTEKINGKICHIHLLKDVASLLQQLEWNCSIFEPTCAYHA